MKKLIGSNDMKKLISNEGSECEFLYVMSHVKYHAVTYESLRDDYFYKNITYNGTEYYVMMFHTEHDVLLEGSEWAYMIGGVTFGLKGLQGTHAVFNLINNNAANATDAYDRAMAII